MNPPNDGHVKGSLFNVLGNFRHTVPVIGDTYSPSEIGGVTTSGFIKAMSCQYGFKDSFISSLFEIRYRNHHRDLLKFLEVKGRTR